MVGCSHAPWAAFLRGVITFALRRLAWDGGIASRMGLGPIFRFCSLAMLVRSEAQASKSSRVEKQVKNAAEQIAELIAPTVEALGLELWGIELQQQGKYSLLRVYIENEEGVSIEDCERVSRQVSAVLDVEDPISGEYTLEVSSPGMDRPLFTAAQFGLYVGEKVNVRLRSALQGRRKFKGVIKNVVDDRIGLAIESEDGEEIEISFANIDKANIDF